ncbi:hypothetical protein NDU88_005924 [Pleurodeles waltl]|uniref:Uncharacterized protein n=1 Tax=Pleurodeles waltl TaxID=8319 RepID=A0AAV7MXQ7_PLEWA|nr:hypothetical protein NDU88_005924 [Pleurodeles waltl]
MCWGGFRRTSAAISATLPVGRRLHRGFASQIRRPRPDRSPRQPVHLHPRVPAEADRASSATRRPVGWLVRAGPTARRYRTAPATAWGTAFFNTTRPRAVATEPPTSAWLASKDFAIAVWHWGEPRTHHAFATATRPRKRFRPKRQQEDRLPATQSGLGWQRAHGSHYIAIPSPRGTACINATRPRAQGALAQRQDHTPSVPAITIATPGAGKADTPPACRQALTTTPGAGKLGKFTLQGLQGTAHKRDATLQHEHSLSQYQGNAKKS